MKLSTTMWISICCLLGGLVYYGIQKKMIIIQMPSYTTVAPVSEKYSSPKQKQQFTLYYWAQGSFKHEITSSIIDTENKVDSVRCIVTSWLTILEQSGILHKKIGIETVMLSNVHDLYISFDHTIFTKNEPTFDKWMCIEALLKTLRVANLGINQVNFFVHHEPLQDQHVDFSRAWPINGFLES